MITDDQRWFFRRGQLSRDGWESVVDDAVPRWQHTGIRVAEVGDGDVLALADIAAERIIVPLSGSFHVVHRHHPGEWETRLNGRRSVFHGPTDVLYLPCGVSAEVRGEGRFAVAESPTDRRRPWRYIPAEDVPIELRGAGRSSRQVHNFGTPGALDATRLIVCEVVTPAENWSSYPPHKHDEHAEGQESRLEEIYYFESAPARGTSPMQPDAAFGMFSAYSSPAGDIEIDAMVRTGDIALVPYGYHGPAAAAPGYDLYYLNVMAGPDPDRAWLISDDPAHAWVRDSWDDQPFDARLPYRDDAGGPQ
ncbi:5-deoxy-glucuronate isomerase [Microbacterium sp. KUDC0406]|uniref:5-deoxy-glucuronate isomerase n=1 Tax=Microbacterium sp. KUDC0406 TaxID=2909588 RepID=UPI001F281B1C|nr:5-deoxy-glucuronate isomerase [Microbacterium sp. KUDC0406]UJP09926.1 5-deoxy-glucuronate isomerase [Microbacterium sp. KUDC0406]